MTAALFLAIASGGQQTASPDTTSNPSTQHASRHHHRHHHAKRHGKHHRASHQPASWWFAANGRNQTLQTKRKSRKVKQRGPSSRALLFFLLRRLTSRSENRPVRARLAPRERCAQQCCAVKPGGVIRFLRSL